MLLWIDLLGNNDNVGGGCELEQTSRFRNQEAPSHQGQRRCFVYRDPEGFFRAVVLCKVTIEPWGTKDGLWRPYSSDSATAVCTQIKHLWTLMTSLCLLEAIKRATNSNSQSWVTTTNYPIHCASERNHSRKEFSRHKERAYYGRMSHS